MKNKLRFMLLIAFLISIWQSSVAQISPPGTYKNLGSGNKTINDTIPNSVHWLRWQGDSVVQIKMKLLYDGSVNSIDSISLYQDTGGSLALRDRDSIKVKDSTVTLYYGYVPSSTTFYIRFTSKTSTCSGCIKSNPIISITCLSILSGCSPVTPCDLVNNGDFETKNCGTCAGMDVGNFVPCWQGYEGTSDIFARGSSVPGFNLGTNTYSFNPSIDSHNGAPNNNVAGLASEYSPGHNIWSESIQSLLNTPLVTGQTYQISFWAYNYVGPPGVSGTGAVNQSNSQCVVTIASSNGSAVSPYTPHVNTNFPAPVHPIADFHINAANYWTQYTATLVYSGPNNDNNILIGINQGENLAEGITEKYFYIAIDDISIKRVYTPTVTAGAYPGTILCAGKTATLTAWGTGLTSYTWTPGNLTGQSVAVTPTASTVYTVVGSDGCKSATTTISITVNPNPTITPVANPSLICSGSPSTLTATGGLSTTYTWTPGGASASIVVSPTVATTYTVTGRDPNFCYGSGIITVYTQSVNPIVYPSPTICVGNTATLSATSNATSTVTYTWQPGNQTGSPVQVTPSVTTIYTVTAASSNCTFTRTLTVNVNNFSSISVSPAIICPGQSSTLTASGATSYTWHPQHVNGASVVVSPTVTTTYTVFGTIPSCGTASAVVTVSVISVGAGSVTVSSSVPYPSLGASITLTASITPAMGTYTYNWGAPLNQTGSSITFNPTENNVYTCNVTDMCGGISTGSICVSVKTSSCDLTASTMDGVTIDNSSAYNNINGTAYKVYGTIIITGDNVNWYNADLRIQPGAQILIAPGAKLTLSRCNLYSCADMWEGITVQCNGASSGSITVTSSKIEDAYRAVYYDGQNTPYPANIQVTYSDLNKNYIGVSLNNCRASGLGPNSNFLFSNYHTQASLTSPGNNLKCSSYYTPSIKGRGYAGVQFNNELEEIHIGPVGTTTTGISNTFDKLDYGYYGSNSIVRLHQDAFSNMTGDNTVHIPPLTTPGVGTGIYSVANNTLTTYPVEASLCTFTNVWRGVETNGMNTTILISNTFSNTVNSPNNCGSGCVGNTGVYLANTINYSTVKNNSITNFLTGIIAKHSQLITPSTYSIGVGTNTISATGSGTVTQGIQVEDAINTFNTAGATMQVAANTLSNVKSGIYILNIKNGMRVSNNNIGLLYSAAGTNYGIRLNGAQNATVDNNTASSTSTANVNLSGIYLQSSPACLTQCNMVSNVGQAFVFEGNCLSTPSGFVNNNITNANDGLVLKNNGIIGQQGMNGNVLNRKSSGNQWNGNYTRSRTIVYDAGSSAQSSPFIIRNTGTEYPQPQSYNTVLTGGTANPGNDNYGVSPNVTPGTMTITTYNLYSCPATLTVALKQQQTTAVNPTQVVIAAQQEKQLVDSSLFDLVQGLDSMAILEIETEQINRQYVFEMMDRGYSTQHAGLNTFYNVQKQTSLNNYSDVDQLIEEGSLSTAQALNSSAQGTTSIDQNQQALNQALITHLQDPAHVYTQSEVDDLMAIAIKCPLSDGNAVYQARALLSVILNANLDFADPCNGVIAQKQSGKVKGIDTHQDSYLLFPNPNNGSMTLAYDMKQNAQFIVYDLQGRLVYQQPLSLSTNMVQFSLENLNQGVYHYVILREDGIMAKTDKLVIIK